jgi:hypothetical protein
MDTSTTLSLLCKDITFTYIPNLFSLIALQLGLEPGTHA